MSKHLEYAKWTSIMRKLDNKIKHDALTRKANRPAKAEKKKDK